MLNNTISCNVCSHHCRLKPGQIGLCHTRGNINGSIETLNYETVSSIALDPIEKKPLAHFYPGSQILSVGNFGCNFNCPFCQNHSISMNGGESFPKHKISPTELVNQALKLMPYGNIGIAFTYNEPLVNYEYVLDTEKFAHKNGLKTVVVTNGGINPEIFREVAQNTDAFNIDLKGIKLYPKIGGDLETVKQNIKTAHDEGCHVEVTTLVVPGVNDTVEEMEEISKYLASIDENIPLHITRFFPNYKMDETEATPIETLHALAGIASKYLNTIHLGNV